MSGTPAMMGNSPRPPQHAAGARGRQRAVGVARAASAIDGAAPLPAGWRAMRLGMLTPSSNTVLEPMTATMLAELPGASAHFSRFRVVSIDLGAGSREQFDPA